VSGGGRQRRWSLALVAVLVTLGSALAFVVLWLNAGGRKPVLALRNDVAAGQVIEADDLMVVRVSTDGGIAPIPSSQRDEVIGETAAATLLAGSLLVEGSVGDSGLQAGTAVIAIPVERVRLPDDLAAGDQVRIYRTVAAQGGQETTGPETLGPGVVLAVEGGDDDTVSEVRVSVTVSESLAPAIASAVQADQIYIVKTAAG
jgi:hypothetical protein